jgi:chromosome segregation ATPase
LDEVELLTKRLESAESKLKEAKAGEVSKNDTIAELTNKMDSYRRELEKVKHI